MSVLLVDTGVWIDHLRRGDATLGHLLMQGRVLGHAMVTGEIAMGSLANRPTVLGALQQLPQAVRARDEEVIDLIERQALFSLGLGFIDAHLLAATLLTPGALLWTRDKRLADAAASMAIAALHA
ncbi:MAG: VapC toxin family PIN domain ribonuclease [Sphingomonas sp.]|uniref:type II toxin-antitoxin system VapC family toxin n=1 Tax=Sphingomonas sp. TaxID=28214 RepID=UPI0025F049D5|nr:PIN domain-containing protein [Sphingomonas sp.]MBY0283137.1 VapC toxin family PIN domain ribonuclease [Sphingomonas sp.]